MDSSRSTVIGLLSNRQKNENNFDEQIDRIRPFGETARTQYALNMNQFTIKEESTIKNLDWFKSLDSVDVQSNKEQDDIEDPGNLTIPNRSIFDNDLRREFKNLSYYGLLAAKSEKKLNLNLRHKALQKDSEYENTSRLDSPNTESQLTRSQRNVIGNSFQSIKIKPFLPEITLGDQFPVAGETERSESNIGIENRLNRSNGDSSSSGDEESKLSSTQKDVKEREHVNLRLINLVSEFNQQDSVSATTGQNITTILRKTLKTPPLSVLIKEKKVMIKKPIRSESADFANARNLRSPDVIVKETFNSDCESQLSDVENNNLKVLDKEYYKRKIVICEHVPFEKNQYEYLDQKRPTKDKFRTEMKLLDLEATDDEESDDERASSYKNDDNVSSAKAKTKYLESLKKKMEAKSNYFIAISI